MATRNVCSTLKPVVDVEMLAALDDRNAAETVNSRAFGGDRNRCIAVISSQWLDDCKGSRPCGNAHV